MKRFFGSFSRVNSVRGASVLLITTLTLSNILGLIRDRFLTKNISTFDLDVYYSSFRIPDLIFNVLILSAITSAFIPIFSDFIAGKKESEGFKMTSSLINLAFIVMLCFALIMFVLMPYVMRFVVPEFDVERLNMATANARLLMLTPIFFSLSYIIGGVLNSFKRFVSYSLAPLVYNLSIIFGAAFLAPKYGLSAVIYCVIAGSFLHFIVQVPALLRVDFKYSFIFDFRNSSIKRIVRLMIPRTIGMGVNQFMLIIFTAIASSLAVGSITAFELSNNIQTMPIVVFGTSFATAVFPTLTLKISQNDKTGFAFYLSRTMRALAFLLIPSTVIFFLLKAQIIRLIYGSGKFTWEDTKMTSAALGFFVLSLLAQALIGLLARAFYALKNTRTPMYTSIIAAVSSILLGYLLAKIMGVSGLTLAFSIASYINAILLFILLKKKYPDIWNAEIVGSYLKITLISIAMGLVSWGVMHIASNFVDMNRFVGVLAQTLITLLAAGVTYFSLSYLFDCEEMKWALTRKINGEKLEKK